MAAITQGLFGDEQLFSFSSPALLGFLFLSHVTNNSALPPKYSVLRAGLELVEVESYWFCTCSPDLN